MAWEARISHPTLWQWHFHEVHCTSLYHSVLSRVGDYSKLLRHQGLSDAQPDQLLLML